jgi:hypothetical protein
MGEKKGAGHSPSVSYKQQNLSMPRFVGRSNIGFQQQKGGIAVTKRGPCLAAAILVRRGR